MNSKALNKQKNILNYSDVALNIFEIFKYPEGKLNIVGSQSLETQRYAGDYDLYQTVNKKGTTALKYYVAQFQSIITKLLHTSNCYIADIKAGILQEYEIIPEDSYLSDNKIINFSEEKAQQAINRLKEDKIISTKEAKQISKNIKAINPNTFLLYKKEYRYHILRWTPQEVLLGYKQIVSNRTISLEEAFQQPAIVKIDTVVFDTNKYSDFSCIYTFYINNKPINKVPSNIQLSLRNDLLYYLFVGDYFKATKRLFSLAKLEDSTLASKLSELLNTDLGLLYSIISDCNTLLYIIENEKVPQENIKKTIESFRVRLGNVYTTSSNTPTVLKELFELEQLPSTPQALKELESTLTELVDKFNKALSSYTKEWLEDNKILPLEKKWYP